MTIMEESLHKQTPLVTVWVCSILNNSIQFREESICYAKECDEYIYSKWVLDEVIGALFFDFYYRYYETEVGHLEHSMTEAWSIFSNNFL